MVAPTDHGQRCVTLTGCLSAREDVSGLGRLARVPGRAWGKQIEMGVENCAGYLIEVRTNKQHSPHQGLLPALLSDCLVWLFQATRKRRSA